MSDKSGALRVAFAIPYIGGDGPGRVFRNLILAAARAGVEPVLLTSEIADQERRDLAAVAEIYLLDDKSYPVRSYWRAVKASKPDVVLATQRATTTSAVSALLHLRHPPLVCRPANHPVENVRHQPTIRRLKIRAAAQLEARAQCRIAAIVCQSTSIESALPAQWRRLPRRVIPNPVDHDLIESELSVSRTLPKPGQPTFVTMGRLMPQKGMDVLIQAFASVRSNAPGARLWIIGDGPDRAQLVALATDLHVDDVIDFLGKVPSPFATLKAADIYVQASRYEGLSNALIEAQVIGLPAVATDGPASGDSVVEIGETGWLARPDSVDSLAASLRLAIAEREAFDRAEIRRRTRSKYSGDAVWEMYASLFQDVAGRAWPVRSTVDDSPRGRRWSSRAVDH